MPQHVRYVLISGAAGGFVSWVYSVTVGTPLRLPALAAIAACCVLGAAAALISVYVVANSDIRNVTRLLIFAMLSGIFWKPVIDSSVSFVNQKRDAAEADAVSESAVRKLTGPEANKPEVVAQATQATTDLLKTSERLNDPRLNDQAVQRTEMLMNELVSGASQNPVNAEQALVQIREAAVATGNEMLARKADMNLREVNAIPRPVLVDPGRPEFRSARPAPFTRADPPR